LAFTDEVKPKSAGKTGRVSGGKRLFCIEQKFGFRADILKACLVFGAVVSAGFAPHENHPRRIEW
jgi:hypothetical protein